jgi:PAS domain S-box-containing protein
MPPVVHGKAEVHFGYSPEENSAVSQVIGGFGSVSPGDAAEPDWQLIADSIPHIVWISAAHGALEYVNRRGMEYVGVPAEQMHDWDWIRLIHPDDADRLVAAWKQASRSEAPFESEFRVRRADGEFRWQISRGQPLRSPDGRLLRWIGTLTDVDDERRFQEHIARAERRNTQALALLETLLQGAPIGFAFLDADAGITTINDEMAAACGVRAHEIVGWSAADLFGT